MAKKKITSRKNWKTKQDYDEQYVETDLSKQMKEDALAYGIYVIKHRALPDIRDGLLPVHRRIIYTLYHEGVTSNKPYYKNARTEEPRNPDQEYGYRHLCDAERRRQ